MAYDKDTPASINEKFSTSWQKINNNFNSIKTLIDQDHETFDSGKDGKHKQITLTEQSSDPSTGSSETVIYNKSGSLYYRESSDGTIFNMTPSDSGHATSGYDKLPSGLVFCWGRFTIPSGSNASSGSTAYTFTTVYKVLHSVNFTGNFNALDGMLSVVSVTGNTISGNRADTSHNQAELYVDYLVIGK